MDNKLVKMFDSLWESSHNPPDVFAFLKQHSQAETADKLAVVICDQWHRWQTTHPLKVEDYLSQLGELSGDSKVELRLAIGEYHARHNRKSVGGQGDVTARFEELEEAFTGPVPELPRGDADLEQRFATTTSFAASHGDGRVQLGRYRTIRIIGEGGFGRVYLGVDEELHRRVAIKVPSPTRFKTAEDAEDYLREARTVASLDHPNIVPVYDVGRLKDGSIYVVSKYIPGPSLRDLTNSERLTYQESAKLMATVARALDHAHKLRLIHRDVKPANVLIDESTGMPYGSSQRRRRRVPLAIGNDRRVGGATL
jgi:hypothetical protein